MTSRRGFLRGLVAVTAVAATPAALAKARKQPATLAVGKGIRHQVQYVLKFEADLHIWDAKFVGRDGKLQHIEYSVLVLPELAGDKEVMQTIEDTAVATLNKRIREHS